MSAVTKMTYIRNEAGAFVCPDCGITKARQNTMFYHMKKHAGDLSYFCTECDKGFIQKSGLDQHILQAHTVTSGYECPCCDHTCKMKANLIIHIARKHGGDWIPVAPSSGACTCSACERPFSSPTAYYYHAASCFLDKAPAHITAFLKLATA